MKRADRMMRGPISIFKAPSSLPASLLPCYIGGVIHYLSSGALTDCIDYPGASSTATFVRANGSTEIQGDTKPLS